MPKIDKDDISRRAMAAYFRAPRASTEILQQPSDGAEIVTRKKMTYAVLSNANGPLAVYRVRNDGMLKRLKRWPAGIAA